MVAEDGLLGGDAVGQAALLGDGLAALQGQGHPMLRKRLVHGLHGVLHLAQADVGGAVIHGLPHLLRLDPGSQGGGGVALHLVHGLVGDGHH